MKANEMFVTCVIRLYPLKGQRIDAAVIMAALSAAHEDNPWLDLICRASNTWMPAKIIGKAIQLQELTSCEIGQGQPAYDFHFTFSGDVEIGKSRALFTWLRHITDRMVESGLPGVSSALPRLEVHDTHAYLHHFTRAGAEEARRRPSFI